VKSCYHASRDVDLHGLPVSPARRWATFSLLCTVFAGAPAATHAISLADRQHPLNGNSHGIILAGNRAPRSICVS
jgi:hypothetical protein